MDFNLYFLIILRGIFIEKYLLTISGYIAFNFLIPIACIFAILYVLLKNQKAEAIAGKLCAFSMVLLFVVPMSVQLSELIDQTYQISLEQTLKTQKNLLKIVQNSVKKMFKRDLTDWRTSAISSVIIFLPSPAVSVIWSIKEKHY